MICFLLSSRNFSCDSGAGVSYSRIISSAVSLMTIVEFSSVIAGASADTLELLLSDLIGFSFGLDFFADLSDSDRNQVNSVLC